MEKEPTWQQLWNANTRLSTRLAEVERERDAAQNECHNLMKPLRSPNPTISLLRLLLVPTMSGTVTVKQETLGGLIRDVEALTCQRDAAIRERDTLTRQAKVLREALEGTDRYDMVLEKHLGQPHIMSKKSVDGAWVLYHEALSALTSEGAAQ